jgi:hypothetical protein
VTAPKHAERLPHPHLTNAAQLVGDLWFLAAAGWMFVHRMLNEVHPKLYDAVVFVASLALVGLSVRVFLLVGLPVFAALVGVYAVALGVAVKAMGSGK